MKHYNKGYDSEAHKTAKDYELRSREYSEGIRRKIASESPMYSSYKGNRSKNSKIKKSRSSMYYI